MKQVYLKLIIDSNIMSIILTIWYAYLIVSIAAGVIVFKDNIKVFLANRRRWVKNKHLFAYALITLLPCLAAGLFWPLFLEYPKIKK
jgi:hypothetical protein